MMMARPSPAAAGAPAQIYLIRHGEKPENGSAGSGFGVDIDGSQDAHALLTRGWQRAGALAVLFAPAVGPLRAGVQTPTALYAPDYGGPVASQGHRPYQTIEGLSDLLGVPINTDFTENQESALANAVVGESTAVVLVCWEHHRIPAIAAALPTSPGTQIPTWPDDRFDMIWSFTRRPGVSPAGYAFSQIPQLVLAGDSDAVF
jgi:hypothetical protein